jgi:hypothetical protein
VYEIGNRAVHSYSQGRRGFILSQGQSMSGKYSQLADQFIARIRGANLSTATDIALVFYHADAQGRTRRQRVSITPTVILLPPSSPDAKMPMVSPRQLDAIIDSIEKRVRTPVESLVLDGVAVKLVNIELEIDGLIR